MGSVHYPRVSAAVRGAAVLGQNDDDDDTNSRSYWVTIANNTPGQPFTPPAVLAHRASVEVVAVGDEASDEVQQLAENGNLGPLSELAESANTVRGVAVGEEPLVPQEDPADTGHPWFTELLLEADASADYLTFVSMLIATNDGIVGLDTVELPSALNESNTYYANGYDVGTEENTEMFEDLVPPAKTLVLGGESEGLRSRTTTSPKTGSSTRIQVSRASVISTLISTAGTNRRRWSRSNGSTPEPSPEIIFLEPQIHLRTTKI